MTQQDNNVENDLLESHISSPSDIKFLIYDKKSIYTKDSSYKEGTKTRKSLISVTSLQNLNTITWFLKE